MAGAPPFHGVGDPLQVSRRCLAQAAESEDTGGGLALGSTPVIGRGGQLVTNPGVRQQPGQPSIGQGDVLVLQAAAIEQDGVATARLQCRELVHHAGPRTNEVVLRRLAELRDRKRRHLNPACRQQCDRQRDLERAG